ncbi:MAG: gluconate 2-dehydrogenase subunit 3 family protein [Pseudomonadota bacterium]
MPRLTSRRTFLLAGTTVAAGLVAGRNRSQVEGTTGQDELLSCIVDTCIPADESPGALDLGLDNKLKQEIKTKPKTAELINRLIPAVKNKSLSKYRKSFCQLDVAEREALLIELSIDRSQVQNQSDFRKFRRTLFQWYYSSAEGQAGLGYTLPAHYPAYAASSAGTKS